MSSGNEEVRAEPEGAVVKPYEPFPTFSAWAKVNFDQGAFGRYISQMNEMRQTADQNQLDEAIKIATRWTAVNTGAIEGLYEVDRGFTYSVAVSAALIQDIRRVKGDSVADTVGDALAAYDLVLDAATQAYPVNEAWIRELHAVATRSQKTFTVITSVGPQERELPKGEYKKYPNNPLNLSSNVVHSYAAPVDTPSEMARLVGELRSEAFSEAPSVLQAAYAHYAFVAIHPFADGNGRIARALASVFLYRGVGLPLVIFADQKGEYLDALEEADAGTYERFTRFVGERVIDSIGMTREQLRAAAVPDVDSQMIAFAPLLRGRAGLAHEEIDAITLRLLSMWNAALEKAVADTALAGPLTARVAVGPQGANPPGGYRLVPGNFDCGILIVDSARPAEGTVRSSYWAATALPNSDGPAFIVFDASSQICLEAELREIHPSMSQALVFRAETSALREFRVLVSVASEHAAEKLRQAGYL